MKTPEEFRNEYAKALGYVDWEDLFECYDDKGLSVHETAVMEEYAMLIVTNLLSKIKEQLPDAWMPYQQYYKDSVKELLTIKDE